MDQRTIAENVFSTPFSSMRSKPFSAQSFTSVIKLQRGGGLQPAPLLSLTHSAWLLGALLGEVDIQLEGIASLAKGLWLKAKLWLGSGSNRQATVRNALLAEKSFDEHVRLHGNERHCQRGGP
jgi:hypothetical protein